MSIQSKKFVALQQQYEQLSADYEQLRQMVMDIRSQMGDTYAPSFWLLGPGKINLLLLLHCSSLIFFGNTLNLK
jgi:hypothetical protein